MSLPSSTIPARSLMHAAIVVSATLGGACAGESSPAEIMETNEFVADLLGGEPFWTSVREHPAFPPQVGAVTPSLSRKRDGAGTPALILAPPAQITYSVAPGDAPSILRARAGVDISVLQ